MGLQRSVIELVGVEVEDEGSPFPLDSLDGAVFSPPIDAKPSTIKAAEGWSQAISVSVYDLADTTTAVSSTMDGAAKTTTTLYKLSVTIKERGVDKGTWWWWINS